MSMHGEQDVRVLPDNVLTFYRNEQQAAATITIARKPNSKATIRYALKCSNKRAYLVSSSKGTLNQHDNHTYIDILISEDHPLEQCLLDRFKIQVKVEGKTPFSKTLKVAINYKKQMQKMGESTFNKLQIASKTSATLSTANSTILGQSAPAALKKNIISNSKLVQYLQRGDSSSQAVAKSELEEMTRLLEEKRRRLYFLNQQALKHKSRKKFGCYLMVLLMLVFFVLGVIFRKIVGLGDLQLPWLSE